MDVLIQIGLLALGFALLVKGADWFVEGAGRLAEKFGIPQLVIGLTIVAMGTSLPEAAVSVSAALKGSAEITIGNIVGSNIMNILLILGLTALITPVAVQKTTVRYEIPFVILVSVVLVAMGAGGDHLLHFPDGLILWALMLCYLGYLLVIAKKGGGLPEEMPEGKPMPVWKMLLLIAFGGVMIVAGSDVAVDAATELALIFGMSERLIGLTIVAFGTSLPELVTSVVAAAKGETDIAVGNVIGSNLFNLLMVLGLSVFIHPIRVSLFSVYDLSILIIASLIVLVPLARKQALTRGWGILLLAMYGAYLAYIIMRTM